MFTFYTKDFKSYFLYEKLGGFMVGIRVIYIVLEILVFILITQIVINYKTSQVITSDVIVVVNSYRKILNMGKEI